MVSIDDQHMHLLREYACSLLVRVKEPEKWFFPVYFRFSPALEPPGSMAETQVVRVK